MPKMEDDEQTPEESPEETPEEVEETVDEETPDETPDIDASTYQAKIAELEALIVAKDEALTSSAAEIQALKAANYDRLISGTSAGAVTDDSYITPADAAGDDEGPDVDEFFKEKE